jgi:hypothetical protein
MEWRSGEARCEQDDADRENAAARTLEGIAQTRSAAIDGRARIIDGQLCANVSDDLLDYVRLPGRGIRQDAVGIAVQGRRRADSHVPVVLENAIAHKLPVRTSS